MPPPSSPFTPLVVLAVLLACAGPLVAIGFPVQAWIERRTGTPRPLFVLLSFAWVGGIGYALSAAYLAGAGFGTAASIGLLAAAACVAILPSGRARARRIAAQRDIALPLLLLLGTAYFDTTLHLGTLPDPLPSGWNWTRQAHDRQWGMPPDNQVPLIFASMLYEAKDLRAGILKGHSSNRPPLQAGIVLVAYPAWAGLEALAARDSWLPAYYQVLGALLQCSWVAAVYALLRVLGFSRRRTALTIVALVPSHFFFLHAVYVWPKLLAGSLGVGAFCLLLPGRGRAEPVPTGRMAVAATLAALAFLSHGGVATSLIAFGIVLAMPRWFPGWRAVLVGALVCAAWLAPWTAYQRYYDPPGNYVAKRHLAGVMDADDRSTWEAVRDAYSGVTLGDFARTKLRDLRIVLGVDRAKHPIDDVADFFATLRHFQFIHVFASFDVLNAGWIAALLGMVLVRGDSRVRWRKLGAVLAVGILCLLVWIGVQVSLPIIQHGSFAAMILLFAGLAGAIGQLPRWLGVPLLALHGILSLAIIQLSAGRAGAENETVGVAFAAPTLAAAVLALALLVFVAMRAERGRDDPPEARAA